MGKKIGEMTKAELAAFLEGVPVITKEDKEDYGIPNVELNEQGYCDDAEVMEKTMACLGDKFLAQAAILEAKQKASGGC